LPCKSHHTGTFSGVLCQLSVVMTPLHTVRSEMRIKGLAICCYYCYCFSPVCSKLQQKRSCCCCSFLGADAMTIGFQLRQQIETHSRDRRAQKEKEEAKARGWLPPRRLLRRQRSAPRRASQGQVKRNIGRRRKETENESTICMWKMRTDFFGFFYGINSHGS
jgi:hypothetical protein